MTSVYIAVKNPTNAENDYINDARSLILHIDNISATGEEAGLNRLDEYVFAPLEDIAEFLLNAGASEEEIRNAHTEIWYDPGEGKNLLRDYIALLEGCHSLSESTKKPVIAELKEFYKIMASLEMEKNKWRFQYDI